MNARTIRILLAGLAGGIAMFVWASFAHLTPQLAGAGFQKIPNEPTVLAELGNSLGGRQGLFIYPASTPGDMKGMEAKLAANPSGLLIYHPAGAKGMEPRQLMLEFLLEVFESLMATVLLTLTVLTGLPRRIGFFAAIGVIAAVVTNGSYWLWYGFPAAYSLTAMFVELVKFLVAGVAATLVLGRRV